MPAELKIEVVSGTVAFIRKELRADELYPVDQRYNDTTGEVEYTPDGGSTWLSAPELDPRNQTNIPPRPGTDISCQGAASVAEYLKRYITLVLTLLTASATLVQGATAIVGFLKIISGGYAILWELITEVFATLTGYGAVLIGAAFDDSVYHEIACILMCNMDASGQLNAESFENTKAQITTDIGGTAGDVTNLLLDLMGFAGVNRAAHFYDMAEDCGDCASCGWCRTWDLAEAMPDWLNIETLGSWVSGVGIQGTFSGTDFYGIRAGGQFPSSAHVTGMAITMTSNKWFGTLQNTARLYATPDSGVAFAGTTTHANNSNPGAETRSWSPNVTVRFLRLALDVHTDAGHQNIITRITLSGDGENPWGASNC